MKEIYHGHNHFVLCDGKEHHSVSPLGTSVQGKCFCNDPEYLEKGFSMELMQRYGVAPISVSPAVPLMKPSLGDITTKSELDNWFKEMSNKNGYRLMSRRDRNTIADMYLIIKQQLPD